MGRRESIGGVVSLCIARPQTLLSAYQAQSYIVLCSVLLSSLPLWGVYRVKLLHDFFEHVCTFDHFVRTKQGMR